MLHGQKAERLQNVNFTGKIPPKIKIKKKKSTFIEYFLVKDIAELKNSVTFALANEA